PGYLYSTSPDGVYVNFYHSSDLDWSGYRLSVKTEYPWGDTVEIGVDPAAGREFTVYLRIPGWSPSAKVGVNGRPAPGAVTAGEYFPVKRRWQKGDRITLKLDVGPRLTVANPLLRENRGRVAVERGPLVYCMEQADQPTTQSLFDISLAGPPQFQSGFRKDLLDGVLVLRHRARVAARPLASEPLYRTLQAAGPPSGRPIEAVLIPYYAWANREPMNMQVWIPYAP
ncbi:MAG: glycoside hydrolase family 127 protein, partial [Bryobacterales bacterium]|nr:glycoside hydrolase family 127 protein [Bryobacterales bacterium]